jgi:hypothetical protein
MLIIGDLLLGILGSIILCSILLKTYPGVKPYIAYIAVVSVLLGPITIAAVAVYSLFKLLPR